MNPRAQAVALYAWNKTQERTRAAYYSEEIPRVRTVARGQSEACRRGHLFDEDNTYVHPDGWRTCRTCKRAADARRREKNREATDAKTTR